MPGFSHHGSVHVGVPMGVQMIPDRLHPLDGWGHPRLHRRHEVDLVGRGTARRRHGQRLASGGLEGAKDRPCAAASVVDRLACPSHWAGRGAWPHGGGHGPAGDVQPALSILNRGPYDL